MFVDIFLIDAKAHTVVPKQFVLGLVEVNLLNSGVNQNQNRLIYFSSDLFDLFMNGENPNLLEFIPNFDLEVTTVYPPPDNLRATCYRGRLMKFWETFDDAFRHANRLRPYLPALINPARQFEMPIPPMQNNVHSNNEQQAVNDSNREQILGDEQHSNANENNTVDEQHVEDVHDEQPNDPDASEYNGDNDEMDIKPFGEIQLQDADIYAFDEIFNEQTINSDFGTVDDAVACDENGASGSSTSDSVCPIVEKLNDSLEITYESNQDFRPKADDGFIVKANDAFSSNWPFMQNVIHFLNIDFNSK